jgi:hypothetical protein
VRRISEEEKLDLMLSIFEWEDTVLTRYHALLILRAARREQIPTFDDFKAGRDRSAA